MKRLTFITLFVVILLLSGCKTSDNKVQSNETDTEDMVSYTDVSNSGDQIVQTDTENAMSFELVSDPVTPGQDVVVSVKTVNNPGFLTMALILQYDDSAMSLLKVENGSDFSGYYFMPPKNMKNNCKFSWFITDIPDETADGELIKLYFHVFDSTDTGEYPIIVSPVNDGGIVDGNNELMTVFECNDVIKVK